MDLKKILKKAFDAGYDTSVMYNCGDGNAYEDFESFYRSEIKQLTLTDVSQQRELLIDFMNKTQGNLIWGWNVGGGEKLADEYLKGNL